MRKMGMMACLIFGLLMFVAAPAIAGIVEGEVDPVNNLDAENYESSDFSGAASLSAGGTDVKIADVTISDNHEHGWKLTLTSTNGGKLIRAATITAGDGTNTASELTYTNIKLVKTGGTLGTGLMDPDGQSKDIAGGTCYWDTGTLPTGVTPTDAYAANFVITYAANSNLLQGYYRDTITMALAVDDD